MKKTSLRFRSMLIILLLFFGCLVPVASAQDSPSNSVNEPSPEPQKAVQSHDLAAAFDVACRNYRLGPDDHVSVLFEMDYDVPVWSFKLDVNDKLRITCLIDPQLSSEVTIRPDGMVVAKGIGEIQAAGLKPDELARKIEQKYLEAKVFSSDITKRDLGNFRLVTVEVVQFYEKINKLVDALRSLSTGRGVRVKPDGTIDLPLLKERVLCAGFTVSEVENTVNRLYREGVLVHVVVKVSLRRANDTSMKFYVLGQVKEPGAREISGPLNVFQALSMAGGHKADSADLTSVILISKDGEGKPVGRRLDAKIVRDERDASAESFVKPYDVIYVPQTYIKDVNAFMHEYVRVLKGIKPLVGSLIPSP